MSTTGNKTLSSGHRTKTLTNHLGRATINGDSGNVIADDVSSGTKPQNNSTRRSTMKPIGNTTSYKKTSTVAPGSTIRLESQYAMKKKRYLALKKELTDKQKIAQGLYNDILQVREKVLATGAKDPGKVDELKFEIRHIKQTLSLPIDQKVESCVSERSDTLIENPAITGEFIESFENRLEEIPKGSQQLCRDMLEKHSTFITFVTSWLTKCHQENKNNNTDNDDTINDNNEDNNTPKNTEIATQLELYRKDNEDLKTRLNEVKVIQTRLAAELTKNANVLYDEYQNYRARWKEANEMESQKELQLQMNVAMEELQLERDRNNQGKERLRQAELQLQKARLKIRELETHIANDEGKIQQLQSNVKSLENNIKQKDQAMDQRIKDMQKTMKNSEGLVAKVEKQRDSFESRLMELKEKMTSRDSDSMNMIKELSEKLKAVTEDINEERDKRQLAEDTLKELQERYRNLEEKSEQLYELAEKNKDFIITEGSHTDNEARLFNELQAARVELKAQKEKMMQLQQEKEEIIAVMHQAADHDDDESSKERLAAELVFKSNELQNLMVEYTELKKVAKNAQERSGILERQLIEIQTRLHTQLKEGGKAALNAHAIELQQQVSDLRNNLAEVIKQKDELETALTQKQLEVEQRDRVMREQSKFLKVKDELLGLLKGGNQQDNGELSNSDENNEYMEQIHEQIAAKTEAIQELYSTLESKQLQIMRLEKMVKLMEDQQDRAQAQRTRLENRIAQLELSLQKNKEHRSKGFGIL